MNLDTLLNRRFAPYEVEITPARAILYALSTGMGRDPMDRRELPFVYEEAGLKVHPLLATAVALEGFWGRDPSLGLDWKRMVLGEQGAIYHQPLESGRRVVSTARIVDVADKGSAIGAFIYMEVEMRDVVTGVLIATLQRTVVARGDGGFGGRAAPPRPDDRPPERPPELTCDLPTSLNQALVFRLNGDLNPLHADPDVAAVAGFPRPILHGLGTLGVAGHALLKRVCDYVPERMREVRGRFAAPVFPGETLRTELWTAREDVWFRVKALERDAVVLTNGRARIAAG